MSSIATSRHHRSAPCGGGHGSQTRRTRRLDRKRRQRQTRKARTACRKLRQIHQALPRPAHSLFNALAGAITDGAGHLDVIMQRTETCDYPTPQRSPRATTRRPLQDKGHCSRGLAFSQRGAQWAPGPVPVPR